MLWDCWLLKLALLYGSVEYCVVSWTLTKCHFLRRLGGVILQSLTRNQRINRRDGVSPNLKVDNPQVPHRLGCFPFVFFCPLLLLLQAELDRHLQLSLHPFHIRSIAMKLCSAVLVVQEAVDFQFST